MVKFISFSFALATVKLLNLVGFSHLFSCTCNIVHSVSNLYFICFSSSKAGVQNEEKAFTLLYISRVLNIQKTAPSNRCFSHVLDGYAELSAVNKRSWRLRKEQRKSHHFAEVIPQVPPGPPRSTISR